MRACPNTVTCPNCDEEIKCGHVDPEEWRQVPWKFEVDFCHTEDFARLHPDLYKQLESGRKVVLDETFAYRYSGKSKKAVWRVWRKLYEWGGMSAFNIPMEAARHKFDSLQLSLVPWLPCT